MDRSFGSARHSRWRQEGQFGWWQEQDVMDRSTMADDQRPRQGERRHRRCPDGGRSEMGWVVAGAKDGMDRSTMADDQRHQSINGSMASKTNRSDQSIDRPTRTPWQHGSTPWHGSIDDGRRWMDGGRSDMGWVVVGARSTTITDDQYHQSINESMTSMAPKMA